MVMCKPIESRRSFLGHIAINQRKRIARELPRSLNPIAHVRFHGPIRNVFESVRTRVLVRQGCAHPRLHVAHLGPEQLAAVQPPHLLQRAAHLIHRIVKILEAVMEGGSRSWLGSVVGLAGKVGDVGSEMMGLGETDGDGHASELGGILLDGVSVAGERSVAELGI